MLGFTKPDLADCISVKTVKNCVRIAEDNGRVCRDEELGVARCCRIMNDLEEGKPPSGLNPQHSAIASSSVDLPLPFSQTKKVTLFRKDKSIPLEKARILNGRPRDRVTAEPIHDGHQIYVTGARMLSR
jgi:hypothetical protein